MADKTALTLVLSGPEQWNWSPNPGIPWGCAECPFSSVNPNEPEPNYCDPDEGYYDCALIGERKIWGEGPKCTGDQWRERARQELAAIEKAHGLEPCVNGKDKE